MTTKPYVGQPGGVALTTTEQTIIGPVPSGEEWSVSVRVTNSGSTSANLTERVGLSGSIVGSRATNYAIGGNVSLDVERGMKLPANGYLTAFASTNNALLVSWTIMRRSVPS